MKLILMKKLLRNNLEYLFMVLQFLLLEEEHYLLLILMLLISFGKIIKKQRKMLFQMVLIHLFYKIVINFGNKIKLLKIRHQFLLKSILMNNNVNRYYYVVKELFSLSKKITIFGVRKNFIFIYFFIVLATTTSSITTTK
jgi:hypothetical protein